MAIIGNIPYFQTNPFQAISVCAEVPGPRAWRVSDPQMRRLERPSKWQYAAGRPWHDESNMIKSHWKSRIHRIPIENIENPMTIAIEDPMNKPSFQMKSDRFVTSPRLPLQLTRHQQLQETAEEQLRVAEEHLARRPRYLVTGDVLWVMT